MAWSPGPGHSVPSPGRVPAPAPASRPASSSSTPPPPYDSPGLGSPYEQPCQSPAGRSSVMLGPEHAWHTRDPRSSSTQSLVPSLNENEDRRTLLVVYIHGFMGDNTSFRSFPAHVHYFLREQLSESHVVHSKIYPRYKTYKAIEVARDKFSAWLEPHEGDKTDVVLVGHSMGGLLAADVALIPSPNPVYGSPFKHRILGTISLDAPLLGLHPGIITSGIASLFRKAPDPPGREQELSQGLASQNASGSMLSLQQTPSLSSDAGPSSGTMSPVPLSTLSSSISVDSQPDPNFNPTFYNDIPFVDRGFWKNVAHFAKKHYSEGLVSSTYHHLLSHLEFGSCLADYSSLKNRYNKIRRLEDVDVLNRPQGSRGEPRVRFVNYYTVSTGIPKEPPMPKRADTHLRPVAPDSQQDGAGASGASTPRISIEDYSDTEEPQTLHVLEPLPVSDDEDADHQRKDDAPNKHLENGEPRIPEPSDGGGSSNLDTQTEVQHASSAAAGEQDPTNASSTQTDPDKDETPAIDHDLPAIPDPPEPPQVPDFTKYSDKEARKQAEKEFKRTQKGYEQAVKNRDKAIKERQKLVEKRQKKAQKEADKRQKEEAKRLAKEQQAQAKQTNTGPPPPPPEDEEVGSAADPSRPSEAQVVTPAQAQILERQLTDLAFRERGEASSPPPQDDQNDGGAADEEGKASLGAAAGQRGKKKLRKFCMMPQKVGGARDRAWVEVYMKDVDEVGAHCGLFFSGPHYEILIGDVGSRIVDWVREDASTRAILAMN
ncbi:hypothetical protein KVR01_011280 [Diaporthe batatas]|uniref:uncharacterized protein n=1 Tax=Diaporthe batatas TaxID=748121 RepID=UPI001D047496|nr:uncharacterized protein KVR01_011280 [Diaporthe batatas]KAG8158837.1 hypothetical protein KVR01_011280 [Diaporthe batatas]